MRQNWCSRSEGLCYYAVNSEYKSMIDETVKSYSKTDRRDLVRQTSLLHKKIGTDLHQGWTALCCLCAMAVFLCAVTASQLGCPYNSAQVSLLAENWNLLASWKSLWDLTLALPCLLSWKMSFPLALHCDSISTVSLTLRWCCGSLYLYYCVLSDLRNLPTRTTAPHCNEESLRSDLRLSTAMSK